MDSGALDSLVACLEEFDPGVKESAAWAMGYIAGHNAELAGTVVDSGAVALLVLCVQVCMSETPVPVAAARSLLGPATGWGEVFHPLLNSSAGLRGTNPVVFSLVGVYSIPKANCDES